MGHRRVRANAAKRLAQGQAHGMLVRLEEDCLMATPTASLERLVGWLGVLPRRDLGATEGMWRRALVLAILREEKRLSMCRRSERWLLRQRPV